MSSLEILIADDSDSVRRGLRSLLASRADWHVCGEASNGREAVEQARKLKPNIILMDVSMPEMSGLDASRLVLEEMPECNILIVSQKDPALLQDLAAQAGAKGIIEKSMASRELIRAIDDLVNNQTKREETVRRRSAGASSLLTAIVNSSDDAIISKNLDGIITSWNKSAERLFGYTEDEAIGRHITLIIPEDRYAEEADIIARLRRGERIEHFETVRVRKDGTLLDLALTISPVRDETGRVVGASKVARDVGERKRIEHALRERARLLDLSNDAILVRDGNDRITYWNQSATELYGYSHEEAVGSVSHELLRTQFHEPVEHIAETLHKENRWKGELTHRRKDGSLVMVASRWAADRDSSGKIVRTLETNTDVSQQKLNEKALRESEERLRTLSDSLEIQVRSRTRELEQRTSELLLQSEQLRELSNRLLTTQDAERRKMARELHDSAGQLVSALGMSIAVISRYAKDNPALAKAVESAQALVQQLNSELRTTSYLLHPPLLDENGLAQAIRWYMEGLAERSGLKIDLSIPKDFGRLPADLELALFRIVQEGLTNILRHSGSPTAVIRLGREAGKVLLEIEDHGRGVPPEKLVAIRAQRGGVGITGMRERVRHLQGEMDIRSNGMGATISVTLPVPSGEEPGLAEAANLQASA